MLAERVRLPGALVLLSFLSLLPAAVRAQSQGLSVVSAGPQGEVANREEAKEIRIVRISARDSAGRTDEVVVLVK